MLAVWDLLAVVAVWIHRTLRWFGQRYAFIGVTDVAHELRFLRDRLLAHGCVGRGG
jgi:hypothetical protein